MELDKQDLQWIVRCLPKDVRKLLKSHLPRLTVAGGFIRALIAREKPSDVDIFAPSVEAATTGAEMLAPQGEVYDIKNHRSKESEWTGKIIKTKNALTIPRDDITVQFITRWTFDKVEDLLASFDFTIAAAAVWCDADGWHSQCDDKFYIDLAARRLVYRSPQRNEDAGGSMLRVLKFYQRGYRMPLESLAAVTGRLVRGVDWGRIHACPADEQEAQLAKVLTGLLVAVDPNTVNPLGRLMDDEDMQTDPVGEDTQLA